MRELENYMHHYALSAPEQPHHHFDQLPEDPFNVLDITSEGYKEVAGHKKPF